MHSGLKYLLLLARPPSWEAHGIQGPRDVGGQSLGAGFLGRESLDTPGAGALPVPCSPELIPAEKGRW